jgi:ankyrin repeat protein
MAINSLFDKERRERLRAAVKRGDLSRALRKPLKEDLETTRIFPLTAPVPQPSAGPDAWPAGNPADMQHSQVIAFEGLQTPKPLDQSLFDAIKAGDIAKVIDAINLGANLNARYPHVPQHRQGDCIIMSDTSPLQYAKKKGDQVIVKLLERYGAKD